MSIIIKSMEMPKKCEQCWFFGTDSARVGYCYLLKGELPLQDGVPQDCPLIEVPTPHGRLIDADAFEKFVHDKWEDYDHWILNYIEARPTIIPASGGKEDE